MNTQEKEPELGEGVTSAEFWVYDGKLGRRWNVDPVVTVYSSSYLVFSGNPIAMTDVDGDDPTPSVLKIKGKITRASIHVNFIFRFDENLALTSEQQSAYIANYISNSKNTWESMSYRGVKINIDATITNMGNANYGMRNSKLESTGSNVVVDVGAQDPRGNDKNPENVSWAKKGGGYMWVNYGGAGSEAGHELGHLLGLSDRYTEIAAYGEKNPINGQSPIDASRQTIPLKINRSNESDNEYNPLTNLMSTPAGAGSTLTKYQLKVVFKQKSERNYPKLLVVYDRKSQYQSAGANCLHINAVNKTINSYKYNPNPRPFETYYTSTDFGPNTLTYIIQGNPYLIMPFFPTHLEKRKKAADINENTILNKLKTINL
jgi:hypothetical protein